MAVAIAWLPGPAGTRRRVAKPSVEEPDAAEPARPDLWGARVSNDPGLPDHAMVQRLRRNRDALDFGYTPDRFEACISAHFVIANTEPLQSGTRTMCFARPTRTGPGG